MFWKTNGKNAFENAVKYLPKELLIKVMGILSDKELSILCADSFVSGDEKRNIKSVLKKECIMPPEIRTQIIQEFANYLIKNITNFRKIRELAQLLDTKTIDERNEIRDSLIPEIKRNVVSDKEKYQSGKYYWAMATSEDIPKRYMPILMSGLQIPITEENIKGTLQYVDKLSEMIESERFDTSALEEFVKDLRAQLKKTNSANNELEGRISTLQIENNRYREKAPTQRIAVISDTNGERTPTSRVNKLESENTQLTQKVKDLEEKVRTYEDKLKIIKTLEKENAEMKKEIALTKYRGKRVCIIGGSRQFNLQDIEETYQIKFEQILSEISQAKVNVPGGYDLYILRVEFMKHKQTNTIDANLNDEIRRKLVNYQSRGRGRLLEFLAENVWKLS